MQKTKVPKSVRPVSSRWMPKLWASPKPFGLGEQHSNNFWEVFRAVWENRDQLPYAYRILNDGVCDGCSLGTSGMTDWTMNSIHLCNIRLRLLRLNTMGPLDSNILADVSRLESMRSRDLRDWAGTASNDLARSCPNGDLISSQGDAINQSPDPAQQSEIVEFTKGKGKTPATFVSQFSIDSVAGSAFGIAIQRNQGAITFAAVDDTMNVRTVYDLAEQGNQQ